MGAPENRHENSIWAKKHHPETFGARLAGREPLPAPLLLRRLDVGQQGRKLGRSERRLGIDTDPTSCAIDSRS
jgi:hypothetical protein